MPESPWGMASRARWLRAAARKTGISPPGTHRARNIPTGIWTGENKDLSTRLSKSTDEASHTFRVDFSVPFKSSPHDEACCLGKKFGKTV